MNQNAFRPKSPVPGGVIGLAIVALAALPILAKAARPLAQRVAEGMTKAGEKLKRAIEELDSESQAPGKPTETSAAAGKAPSGAAKRPRRAATRAKAAPAKGSRTAGAQKSKPKRAAPKRARPKAQSAPTGVEDIETA